MNTKIEIKQCLLKVSHGPIQFKKSNYKIQRTRNGNLQDVNKGLEKALCITSTQVYLIN